jgi:hypothetical protein
MIACASSPRPASRTPAPPAPPPCSRRVKTIEARGARPIVLVVGVEQMTTTPGPKIGRNLLRASYRKEDGEIEGGFAGVFGQIAGPISSATATSPTRSP